MKKIALISLAAVAAISAASSCNKSDNMATVQPSSDGGFRIYTEITRTTNDGMSTKWKAKDSISVFHAEAGTTEYSSNDKFTLSSEDGMFSGTLTGELAESNDWYAIYPYSVYRKSPADSCYYNIGCYNSASKAQVQAENNSTAHLAGQYFPLCAKAKGVGKGGNVTLTFSPALCVVNFHVTNKTSGALTVSSLSLKAKTGLDIIGSYYINIVGDKPVFTKSGDNYVSNTASLSVTKGAAIAAGESADFYLAVKPFSNNAGDSLTFTVNGYSKTTFAAADFQCGNIKKINFAYDKAEKDYSGTYAVIYYSSGVKAAAMSGESTTSYLPSQEVDYDGSAAQVTVYDKSLIWDVAKTAKGYTFQNQINSKYLLHMTTTDKGNEAYVGELTDSCYMSLQEQGGKFTISEPTAGRFLRYNSAFTRFAFYKSATGVKELLLVKAKYDSSPVIKLTDPDKIAAAGASAVSVPYTIINPVSGQKVTVNNTAEWISNVAVSESAITFDVAENKISEDRSAVVTVKYDGAKDVSFTVTQCAKPAPGAASWTRVTKESDITSGGTFILGYEATSNSGKIVPMQNSGTATITAAGLMYSGTASGSTGSGTIDMSTVTETAAYEVTITASTKVNGAVNIIIGTYYLGNTNTKNNCKLFESEATTTAFTPAIGDNDVVTLKIDANDNYHTLQYNSGSPRFAVYGGTQKNVVLYKKDN